MLHYIGDGSFLPDIPARDLTPEDVKNSPYTEDVLISSGLYRRTERAKSGGMENRLGKGGAENKSATDDKES